MGNFRDGFVKVVGSSELDIWGVVGLRNGFLEISRMGVVRCSNQCE